ncbi:hypothetical protein RDWZM_007323 [Blomia tropicalis]|uniref:C3H1-type domain-containing protein n=1 Tax=Blomia tropicalis TaxID=40697 RepID=A0A9Q0LZM4_BLOTA|nr:hypothetical protein RDWZM_007323 [Blomia tropicalis]
MQHIVAPVDDEDEKFETEMEIINQVGIIPLYFSKMDKSSSATCDFFVQGRCKFGKLCPFRHVKADKNVVCKHWLRGLCKKGDECEFLHVYDVSKMPECYFYSMLNSCTNKECMFLHVNPDSKVKECPWYNRGFCRRGPECRLKHIPRILCVNYLCGFCPNGPKCSSSHAPYFVDIEAFRNSLSNTYATPFVNVTSRRSMGQFQANAEDGDIVYN